jgi:hypothetical protein
VSFRGAKLPSKCGSRDWLAGVWPGMSAGWFVGLLGDDARPQIDWIRDDLGWRADRVMLLDRSRGLGPELDRARDYWPGLTTSHESVGKMLARSAGSEPCVGLAWLYYMGTFTEEKRREISLACGLAIPGGMLAVTLLGAREHVGVTTELLRRGRGDRDRGFDEVVRLAAASAGREARRLAAPLHYKCLSSPMIVGAWQII